MNNRNSVSLPFSNYKQLKDKDEIVAWLKCLPEIVPGDYERKLERLKYMKNQQYKATPGDIFRVELDLHTDGYVLVIGDLRRMQKDKLFGKESIWNSVMTMPLFVRPYLYKTTSRNPSMEEIIAAPLSEQTWIVMDDRFLRGAYEYVAHKTLTEDDVLFPMGYGQQARFTGEEQHYELTWGLGTVSKLAAETDFKSGLQFLNHGVYAGLHSDFLGLQRKGAGPMRWIMPCIRWSAAGLWRNMASRQKPPMTNSTVGQVDLHECSIWTMWPEHTGSAE